MMRHWVVVVFLAAFSIQAQAGFNEGLEAYENNDFAAALAEWQPLAEQGDSDAQYNVGVLYEGGLGVPKNETIAAAWYRKAAEQGNPDAQNDLGQMHDKGAGVLKDHEEAIALYRKAVDQGNSNAMSNLGWSYAKGYGVKKNLVEAERLYKLAAADGNELAQKRLDALIVNKPCYKKAFTELFGEALMCTTRLEMRAAVLEEGAEVTLENDETLNDEYDSAEILEGSTSLSISYVDGKFVRAEYVFDPMTEAGKVLPVRDMVAGKYGKPAKSLGNPALGAVSYSWKLKDGIKVAITRGKTDPAVRLEFVNAANLSKLKRAIKEQEKQAEIEKRNKQSKAF